MAKAYAVENNDPLKHHPFSIETKSIASANSLRGHNATPQEEMSPKVKDNASMGYTLVPTEKTQKDTTGSNITADIGQEIKVKEHNTTAIPSDGIFTISNNNAIESNENEDTSEISLDLEETRQKEKAGRRNEIFRSIVLNESGKLPWMKLLFFTIGTILICFSVTIPQSLIPFSNLVKYPENWYEILLHGTILPGGIVTSRLTWSLQGGAIMNIRHFQSKRFVSIMCFSGAVGMSILLITSYYLWTFQFGYNYPIPFLGNAVSLFLRLFAFVEAWCFIPWFWHQNDNFKKSFRFFFFYILLVVVTVLMNDVISSIVKKSSTQYQPIVALLFPALREATEWISLKLIKDSANGDGQEAKIIVQHQISVRYSILLCTIIGNSATNTTSAVLIALDFSMNIYLCLRIIRSRKRQPHMLQAQIDELQDLALYELVEFQTPLALMMVVCLAYYGSNGALIGNILNDYWTFTAIEDISQTMINMGMFFIVDFCSTITCAILLWVYVKIDLFKMFLALQEEFGKIFCVTLGHSLALVSIN